MSIKPKEKGTIMTCACCGLPQPIYLDSDSAQRVCDECKRHNTGDWQKVARLHMEWVVGFRNMSRERRNEEIEAGRQSTARRDARIKELESELAEAVSVIASQYEKSPIGDLQLSVQSTVVARAESRQNSAFNMRSAAMRVIWRLDRIHHEQGSAGSACSCGKPAKTCRELATVQPFTKLLDDWEDREKDRLNDGRECGLPREHPAMVERFGSRYDRAS